MNSVKHSKFNLTREGMLTKCLCTEGTLVEKRLGNAGIDALQDGGRKAEVADSSVSKADSSKVFP